MGHRYKRSPWLNKVEALMNTKGISTKTKLAELTTEEIKKINPDASVSASYICEICKQKSCPSYDVRLALANVLGCGIEDLNA